MKQTLINREDDSNKFWSAETSEDDLSVITKWGRLGLAGQTKIEDTGSKARSEYVLRELVRNKINKGGYEAVSENTYYKLTSIAKGIGTKNKLKRYHFLECGKTSTNEIKESDLINAKNPGIFAEISGNINMALIFTADGIYKVTGLMKSSGFGSIPAPLNKMTSRITEESENWEMANKIQQAVMLSVI